MVGLTEAVAFMRKTLEEIDVLSIGTTTTPFNIAQHDNAGVMQWNAGLIELMFAGQVEAAQAQAKLLLNNRLHRINVTVPVGQYTLDDGRPEKIRQLISLGRGEAVKIENLDIVEKRFFNGTQAPSFIPVYSVSP